MIIHSLSVSGFGIIGDRIELGFPEECKLGILGSNESGKTTLLEAIEYALYGLRRGPSAEEQRENVVTWGKEEARLKIEFTSGQERYVLERAISVKSGHRVRLVQVTGGKEDAATSLTSVKEVESKIEQIIGMDRDSFTRLVYVKQKDLDALRDLAKSKREQLINKVMGIEVFDTASEKVKEDVKEKQGSLNEKTVLLEAVLRNMKQYEEKQKQKEELEKSMVGLKEALAQKKEELVKAEEALVKHEWLYSFNSASEVLSALKNQFDTVQKSIKEVSDLEEQLRLYNDCLTNYKPKVEELKSLKDSLSDLERRLTDAKDEAKLLETRLEEAVSKVKLSGKEIESMVQDISKKKQSQLTIFAVLLVAAFILILGGIWANIVFTLLGAISLSIAYLSFRRYQELDDLLDRSNEVILVKRQLIEQD